MRLKTFGGLHLEGATFRRTKLLLLAVYLALEGTRDRRHVAELFWPTAADHMKSLTVALAQARKAVPYLLEADATKVWTKVPADAVYFLETLEQGGLTSALSVYDGSFLTAFHSKGIGTELEEWIYKTREVLAASARSALLELAKEKVRQDHLGKAAQLAEKAYLLSDVVPADPDTLGFMHALMLIGGSVRLHEMEKEATDLGISLLTSKQEASEWLQQRLLGRSSHTNLPVRNTSFVGRDLELTELAGLLTNTETPLVTLLGPGGVGKTRLAIQVAQEQATLGAVRDGVYFVALDTLTSPKELPRILADALGVPFKPSAVGLEPIINVIGKRNLLMLLDNFEPIVEAAMHLSTLLQACPNLKLLVTSRVRLNLEEEQIFPINGLPFSFTTKLTLAEAERLDAVNLFVRRAKRARPDFGLSQATLPAILAICELVEGLPLGLELAATWVNMMPVMEIAKDLGQRLDLLFTNLRNVPDRHRSIRSVFEHSWQHLTDREQEVLAKLSVCRGGFMRDAASRITGATLPILASLVDKSLLRVNLEGRYDRHTLLYQFTRDKLAEKPSVQSSTEATHAHYYLDFVTNQEAGLKGFGQTKTLASLEEEFANISVAWRYAAQRAWSEELLNAATALKLFYDAQLRYQDGFEAFAQGVGGLNEAKPEHHRAVGNLLINQADMSERMGKDNDSMALAKQGISLLRLADDLKGVSAGLNLLGALALNRAAHSEARAYFKENIAIAEHLGDDWVKRIALSNLAITEHHSDNLETADDYYKRVIRLHRQAGDQVNVVRTLTNLGQLHLTANKAEEAKQHFTEALQIANEQNTETTKPLLYIGLASVAYKNGDHEEAKALLTTSYDMAKKAGDNRRAVDSLARLGKVKALSGAEFEGLSALNDSLRLALSLDDTFTILGVLLQIAEARLTVIPDTSVSLAHFVSRHPKSRTADKANALLLLDQLDGRLYARVQSDAAWEQDLSPRTVAELLVDNDLTLPYGKTRIATEKT